jgi:two-component system sensor histidine kinase BaeS
MADGSWGGPPWWGPGWRGRRGGRGGLRRGFGCLIVAMATLIVSVGVLVLWLLAGLFGIALAGPLEHLARPAGLVVLVVGFVALIQGVRIARGVGRPLSDLVDAAGRVEAGDYSVRVREAPGARGELRGLGRAFNTMAARLEAEDADRRRLLADVSHELRTPLAVIQGNLEALLDGVYPPDEAHLRPIIDETRVLERLVDDLRTLSLADSGALPLHREPTDPAVLLEDVAAAHRATASTAGIKLRVDEAAGLPTLDLDPVRMKQVLTNLVENAIRAMPDGGAIVLAAHGDGDSLVVDVTDDGPGIAPELRSTLFDRFTKSAGSRGSGLGLAIARAIVTAHGGTIEASPGPGGKGTTLRISLPLASE